MKLRLAFFFQLLNLLTTISFSRVSLWTSFHLTLPIIQNNEQVITIHPWLSCNTYFAEKKKFNSLKLSWNTFLVINFWNHHCFYFTASWFGIHFLLYVYICLRRNECNHENFRLRVFHGYTRFGVFWTWFDNFWKFLSKKQILWSL